MKIVTLSAVVILTFTIVGYWTRQDNQQPLKKSVVNEVSDIKNVSSTHKINTPKVSTPTSFVQPTEVKDAQDYDMNNPVEIDQMVAAMRSEGIPEQEIQNILKPFNKEALNPVDPNSTEAMSYDMNNSAEKQQMLASMKASGMPNQDIQQILKHSESEPQLPIPQ